MVASLKYSVFVTFSWLNVSSEEYIEPPVREGGGLRKKGELRVVAGV
jgi:hypothetical protein